MKARSLEAVHTHTHTHTHTTLNNDVVDFRTQNRNRIKKQSDA